jgi:nitrogen fixation-related uncharacterized protein
VYFPYFIVYMTIGFVLSVAVLCWALSSGQFRDQQRARFIPLEAGDSTKPIQASRWARIETFALIAFVCLGLAASAAVVTFALLKAG